MSVFDNRCRCDGTPMHGSDHCPSCFCEEFEERCSWTTSWEDRTDSEKFGELMRQLRDEQRSRR